MAMKIRPHFRLPSRRLAQPRTTVTDEAMRIMGGYGFLLDYDVERFYRDVRAYRILDGTSDIQRLLISSGVQRRGVGEGVFPGGHA